MKKTPKSIAGFDKLRKAAKKKKDKVMPEKPKLPKNWGKVMADGKQVDFSSFEELIFSTGYVPLCKYDEALHILRCFKIVIGKIKKAPVPYVHIANAIDKILKERGE